MRCFDVACGPVMATVGAVLSLAAMTRPCAALAPHTMPGGREYRDSLDLRPSSIVQTFRNMMPMPAVLGGRRDVDSDVRFGISSAPRDRLFDVVRAFPRRRPESDPRHRPFDRFSSDNSNINNGRVEEQYFPSARIVQTIPKAYEEGFEDGQRTAITSFRESRTLRFGGDDVEALRLTNSGRLGVHQRAAIGETGYDDVDTPPAANDDLDIAQMFKSKRH